ncbi:hypothetical protein [Hugenholtzia roseola]|uniref:hypothetical protein n=1 Tax=Hugenholtzia roseola TaxID=1002 RepID=UPI0012B531CF|nr:hypothetical protein [Hugenholtzia roseola]
MKLPIKRKLRLQSYIKKEFAFSNKAKNEAAYLSIYWSVRPPVWVTTKSHTLPN